jgi:hypothetical protein
VKFNWSGLHLLSFAPGLAGSLASLPLGTLFIILLSTAVLLKLVQSLAMYLASVNMGYYSARVNAEVTGLIHHQILRLTLACASRYPVGDLTYYAGAGPGAVMSQIGIASSFIVNVMGFPRFSGQVDKGHAMTTRLSIDDQPIQNTTPVHSATAGGGGGALPAGGPLLQCRGPTPWASLQQPGPLGAAGPA